MDDVMAIMHPRELEALEHFGRCLGDSGLLRQIFQSVENELHAMLACRNGLDRRLHLLSLQLLILKHASSLDMSLAQLFACIHLKLATCLNELLQFLEDV
jgi:hypothetical protein